jgi:DNA-binding NtrC family response regulator
VPGEAPTAILVADDEALLQRLIARVLQQDGFEVAAVGDGDAAATAVERQPQRFAALVIDARIPPKGAAGPLRAALTLRPDLGVVVVSGAEPDAELAALVRERGAVFLSKPFAPASLVGALRRALAGGAA